MSPYLQQLKQQLALCPSQIMTFHFNVYCQKLELDLSSSPGSLSFFLHLCVSNYWSPAMVVLPIYWKQSRVMADSELNTWTVDSVTGLLCDFSGSLWSYWRFQWSPWLVDQFYHCLHETCFRMLKKIFSFLVFWYFFYFFFVADDGSGFDAVR